ncbi:unnamed protein product [marine sediment metagenome]|uniref:Uncharacterized protein n=1 Tax=marine sediment metagenome TaxID=412755 RepID=X0ZLZ0_9ZZZZ
MNISLTMTTENREAMLFGELSKLHRGTRRRLLRRTTKRYKEALKQWQTVTGNRLIVPHAADLKEWSYSILKGKTKEYAVVHGAWRETLLQLAEAVEKLETIRAFIIWFDYDNSASKL